MKPLRIFTPVWGEEHIHRFEHGLFKSLCWPKNKAALEDNVRYWHIFTTPDEMGELEALLIDSGYPYQLHGIDPIALEGPQPRSIAITNAATEIMSTCVIDQSIFMPAFTDVIFADGSMEAMFAIAQRPRIGVTVPHMRVLPHFLNLLHEPLSCAEMVTAAMKTAHSTWLDAEVGVKGFFRPVSNQFYGGLSWEKCGNLYLVQHVIPNVWMANIEQSDVNFIRAAGAWGAYDHNWPGKLLEEGRNRYIGSSDAAFMVEITEPTVNKENSYMSTIDMQQPDAFHHDEMDYGKFHKTYRTHISVFREA